MDIISKGRGTHFEPVMVDAFLSIQDEFRAIAARFLDSEAEVMAKART